MEKTGRERSPAVERALLRRTDARRTGWCPFCGVTRSGGDGRKGLGNYAWSLIECMSCSSSELDCELDEAELFFISSSRSLCLILQKTKEETAGCEKDDGVPAWSPEHSANVRLISVLFVDRYY